MTRKSGAWICIEWISGKTDLFLCVACYKIALLPLHTPFSIGTKMTLHEA